MQCLNMQLAVADGVPEDGRVRGWGGLWLAIVLRWAPITYLLEVAHHLACDVSDVAPADRHDVVVV